jgi:ABC-type Zn uptake system ZnuABC Zn-binding protein ZnuA
MILICLAAVSLLAGGGCGRGDGGGDAGVLATTAIAADIARHVAGSDAEVDTLLPRGASPHDYGASAKDRARLEDAGLVVAWGAGLEAGLPLDDLDRRPFELADGERDPHVWTDPTLVAAKLPGLADALAEADPEHAERYRRRAAAYAAQLDDLDNQIARILAAIPPARRKLVTSHDALGHFADHYDLDFVGAPFGLTPESQPSAEKVGDLIDRIESARVPAVFAEETDDPEVLEQIAREAGVEVVDDLLVEGFGGHAGSYEQLLRYDARRIAGALSR